MVEKIKYYFAKFKAGKIQAVCAAFLAVAVTVASTLLIDSINTISVFDGEETYTLRTLSASATSAMANLSLKSDNYEIVSISEKDNHTSIEIAYVFPVYITVGDETVKVTVSGGTVEDALKKAGFTPDEHDMIEPSLNTVLTKTAYIDYLNIDYVSESYTETIACSIETIYSDDYEEGTTTLVPGSDGMKVVSCSLKYINGELSEKNVVSEEVITTAVNGKKLIGTGKVIKAVTTSADVKCVSTLSPSSAIPLDANGNPVEYKSKITARATAYTYTGNNCATGVAPQPGYIAVNPKVIPYGTKMYIKTANGSFVYGYAVAADTGGFINNYPNGIDLFMSTKSACTTFGVQNVEIYILN